MKRISSPTTFFYKRVLPSLVFGSLILFMAFAALGEWSIGRTPAPSAFLPAVLFAITGFLVFKRMIFDLVDEVWDAGDMLIVRNKGQEDQVLLSEITNVSHSDFAYPQRVTLSLRAKGLFGEKITFCAPPNSFRFAPAPIIDELIKRADDARRRKR